VHRFHGGSKKQTDKIWQHMTKRDYKGREPFRKGGKSWPRLRTLLIGDIEVAVRQGHGALEALL